MSSRALASLLAGLLSLAPALGAAAAGKQRPAVVLVPYVALPGVPEPIAAKASELLSQELRGRSDLRVAAGVTAKGDPAAERQQTDAALAQAKAAVARAVGLAGSGKHAQAADALDKAIAHLRARPLAIDDLGGALLADAALQLAVERLVAGDEDGGDAALAQVVRLAPGRAVAASDYPPAFVRELEGVRRRLLAAPRGSLRVLAPPGGGDSRVLLDGRVLRGAPVVVKDLIPGEHFVRVERGSQAFASRVVVVAAAETAVAAGTTGLTQALLQGSIDREAAAAAARTAKAAGAQAALFGAVVRTAEGLSVRTFLAFAKGERVVPLWPMVVDAELLGASVQVLRLADDAAAKLDGKAPDAALPIALAGAADGAAVPEVQGAPPPPVEAEALPLAPLVPEAKPATASAIATATATASPTATPTATASPTATATATPTPTATATAPATATPTATATATATAAPAVAPPSEPRTVAAPVATAAKRPEAPPPAAPASAPAGEPPSRRLVIPNQPTAAETDTATHAAPAPVTRRLEAVEPETIRTAREAPPEKKNHTALWIITGVLVAGAAAAGGYYFYDSNRTPSTATVNASWSK